MTLLGQTLEELQQLCAKESFPKYTAQQLCQWIYSKKVDSFDAMTNISLKIRSRLKEIATVGRHAPIDSQSSVDGTKKYVFQASQVDAGAGQQYIEAVYIPADDRGTLCVSCQCGCRMGCRFCVTGQQGFHGNLTVADILNQILSIPETDKLTNIVFMSMGEPLDNYDAIRQTLEVLTATWGLAWSPWRSTVSTVGITPMLKRLLDETRCHVAVSLHNAFANERADIMPMQKAYPIEGTIALLKQYNWYGQRRISFEYTMFKGVNDDLNHAAELVKITRGLRCRVNLIRYHASPYSSFQPSDQRTMETFRDYLERHGIIATIRASRGEDIMAACGLLAGQHSNTIDTPSIPS